MPGKWLFCHVLHVIPINPYRPHKENHPSASKFKPILSYIVTWGKPGPHEIVSENQIKQKKLNKLYL